MFISNPTKLCEPDYRPWGQASIIGPRCSTLVPERSYSLCRSYRREGRFVAYYFVQSSEQKLSSGSNCSTTTSFVLGEAYLCVVPAKQLATISIDTLLYNGGWLSFDSYPCAVEKYFETPSLNQVAPNLSYLAHGCNGRETLLYGHRPVDRLLNR